MSENQSFDPEDFISADASPTAHSDEDEPRGSIAGGIVGALLGALVGVIPWFLASTYTSFFIGWLGFLVGVAACFGYKLLHGRRSARFATVTVIVCSMPTQAPILPCRSALPCATARARAFFCACVAW